MTQYTPPSSSAESRRAWLASLLLHRRNRLMSRFFNAYARLSELGRRTRRRLGRRAAVSAGALALALTLSAAAVRPPPATAAVGIVVDDGIVAPADDGRCSLVEAFHNANNDTQLYTSDGECYSGYGPGDTIQLPYGGVFTFENAYAMNSGGDLTGIISTADTTVLGNDSTITRNPDSTQDFSFISVAAGTDSNLTIENLTFSGGNGNLGGALYSLGDLTLYNVTITGNEALIGGGIFTGGGVLNVYNSHITSNTAKDGGGITSGERVPGDVCVTRYVNIYDSVISNNEATSDIGVPSGGAFHVVCTQLTILNSEITGNDADYRGGGIFAFNSPLVLEDSKLNENTADDGAGIFINGGSLEINASEVRLNIAGEHGGGVRALGGIGPVTITDSVFYGNEAGDDGGALDLGFNGSISGSTFEKNSAGNNGGALFAGGDLTVTGSTFATNSADGEGGGIFHTGDTTTIANSTLSGNTASKGGGILNDGELTIINSTFTDNETDFHPGGGIFNGRGQVHLTHVTMSGNRAYTRGGGIYQADYDTASLTISRSIISGNEAMFFPIGTEVHIAGGEVTADDYNIFGSDSYSDTSAFTGFAPGASDIDATYGAGHIYLGNIIEKTLADNGGLTLTHNLVPGSPALDMAPDADCAADPTNGLDQRGETRPFDVAGEGNDAPDANTCDAGAVEYRPADPVIFMSAKTSGTTADGLAFDNSDILKWDGTEWTKFFDGTDAHLDPSNKPKHNINAFWIDGNDDIIMAFAQNSRKVVGIGPNVDGMDLVKWDGSGFSLWFDGSDVGLTKKTPEKIDALHVLPGVDAPVEFGGACAYYLLISTQGPGNVPAFGGGVLKFGGEDILGFCMTNFGEATAGFWHMVLDGSAVGLPKNAIDSISADGDGDVIYFTTSKVINVDDASGGHSMVFAYDRTTGDFTGPLFEAADYGLSQKVDGLQMN